jgi:hypothetical protein
MTQRPTLVRIASPCPESWDAMTPASGGRHCAACAKTVVDFTWKTDAEVLAFLAQAGSGTCGRFRASQLERPLQPVAPAPASPAPRWRGWLAAALALWGLRAEATGAPLPVVPLRSAQHPRPQPAPLPPTRQVAGRVVRGVVRDAQTQLPLTHAKVKLRGTSRVATTDAHGRFRLWVPARRRPHHAQVLVVERAGFASQTVRVPLAARAAQALRISLAYNVHGDTSDFSSLGTISGAPMMLVEEVAETPSPMPGRQNKADTTAAPAPPRPLKWYQRFTQPLRPKSSH